MRMEIRILAIAVVMTVTAITVILGTTVAVILAIKIT
jgi:hypothetical protein